MSELDDDGRIIERPVQIVVSEPDLLPEDTTPATEPPADRQPA